MVIFREGYFDIERFTCFFTQDAIFETRDHTACAQNQCETFCFTTFKLYTVNRTSEVHVYTQIVSSSFICVDPACMLLTQSSQHFIQICISYSGYWFFNFNCIQILHFEFWVYFKRNSESEIRTRYQLIWFQSWCANRIQFFSNQRFNKMTLHNCISNISDNRFTVHFLNQCFRSFTRTETVNTTSFSNLV